MYVCHLLSYMSRGSVNHLMMVCTFLVVGATISCCYYYCYEYFDSIILFSLVNFTGIFSAATRSMSFDFQLLQFII